MTTAPRRPASLTALLALLAASVPVLACREPRPTLPATSPAPPSAPPSADPALRFVTLSAQLRKAPAEPGKGKGEPRAASVAFLHRGEKVALLEAGPDWSRVRASDGAEGWLRSASLLPAAGTAEATVLQVAWAFDRPDLLAVNAKRKLEAGTLLFVTRTRELFSEVDAGPGGVAWVLSDHLTSRGEDVMAAKLVEKARWLARAGRADEAKEVLGLLRSSQGGSPLVPVLAAELGEAPPALPAASSPVPAPPGTTGPTDPATGLAPAPPPQRP